MYECKNPYGKCFECSLKEKYTNEECPFKSQKECKNCPNYYYLNIDTNQCEMCDLSKNNCNNIHLDKTYLSLSECESNIDKYKCLNNICTLCIDKEDKECKYNALNDCKKKCNENNKKNNIILILIILLVIIIIIMMILYYYIKIE